MWESEEFCRNITEPLLSRSQKSLEKPGIILSNRGSGVLSPERAAAVWQTHPSGAPLLARGTAGLFSGVLVFVSQCNNIGFAN